MSARGANGHGEPAISGLGARAASGRGVLAIAGGLARATMLAAATAALLASAPAAVAAPGDYTIRYDWTGASNGFAGWGEYEEPPLGSAGYQTPYYAFRLALPKLRIAPTPASDGTADRTYPAVDQFGPRLRTLVQAPGTTSIRSASFDDVDYLRASNERQFLRLAVYGSTTPTPVNTYDFRSDTPPSPGAPGMYQNDVPYSNIGPITVDPPEPGASAQVWMATSCDPSCPFVQFGPGGAPRSYGQVGRVTIDLFDPEAPGIATGGELTNGGWTNARASQSATVSATDPGSGIRTVTAVRRRVGGSAVQALNAQADCDDTHVRGGGPGRDAAPCPDRLETSFTQALGALPDGEYSYDVTATDDSTRTTTSTFRLRLDRARPATVSGSGTLKALMGRWTNRDDRLSLLVRGRDSRSGIARVDMLAEFPDGQRLVLAGTDAPCAAACPDSFAAGLPADLSALPDGRTGIIARAIDAAGNVNERRIGTLMLDRVAPPVPIVGVKSSGSSTLLTINPQIDPAPGSGIAGFVITYRRASDNAVRTFRVAAGEQEVRGRGTHARISGRVSGDIPVRSVDRAGNTGRAFSASSSGMYRCVETLEGAPIIKVAKIGELRPGVDTKGSISYGERNDNTLTLSGSPTIKGVSITLTDTFTNSRTDRKSRNADPLEGYNAGIEIVLRKERLVRYEGTKRTGYCKRTVGPKRVFRVVGTTGADIVLKRMPKRQDSRADCNNSARWSGQRRRYPGDAEYSKSNEKTNSFTAGLSVLGVGFTTQNTYSKDSRVTYSRGKKYRWYWLCGDGGRRDAAGDPDPRTWRNLFAGADTSTKRVP